LATERRTVAITPLGSDPVKVSGVHPAAKPQWMNAMSQKFDGRVAPMGWVPDGDGYRSGRPFSPLVIDLDTFRQDIAVVLATGPGMGAAAVEETGFYRQIDTAADQPGSTTVRLPPQGDARHEALTHSSRNVAAALMCFLAALAVFWKAASPRPTCRTDDRCAPNVGGQD
jgi:hypothetical protein